MAIVSYGRALSLHAEQQPDAVAIAHEGRSVSRSELEASSRRMARCFAEHGVGVGDFVTIALPNGIRFLEATFAAWKLGAVPQPVSSQLPQAERNAILDRAQPSLVFGVAAGTHNDLTCLPEDHDTSSYDDAPLRDVLPPNRQALASGGSTGTPKVIVDILPAEVDPDVAFYGIEPGRTSLIPGPLYHAGPFINATVTLLTGGDLVMMTRFDPREVLKLIEKHRIAFVNLVPTMLQRIWRLPEEERTAFDLSSLQSVYTSGAACPAWLKRAWIDWLGPERIFEAYGATERIGGTMITGTEWLKRPGSVGRPTHGRKLKIVGDNGEELPAGEIGEVYMMPPGGQGSTYRYIGAEPRATRDGWESLGDMGYIDEDGFLYLADRRTDMIVTGGSNVYPAEVEAALDAHPNVQSSAVIGLPDDDLGQSVHAIVEAHPPVSESELRSHLEELLVRYKTPRSFEFSDEPLRDDAGKVRRSQLRDQRIDRARDSR
ncbi:MAG: AMP-binding protein [Myxococcota bacterium]|nr:AMP-binding protein [Myxococcota bacterium]